jgi:ribosomal protein L37AE/L43A
MGTLKEIGKGVIVGLIVNGLIILFHFIANLIGLGSPLEFLFLEIPLWTLVAAFIIIIPTVTFYIRSKYTSGPIVSVVRTKPALYDFTIEYLYHGVLWRVFVKNELNGEPYIYCEPNPYCPECHYEMEAEKRGLLRRHFWKCDKCGRLYKCPKEHRKAHEIVEKLVESDIRSKINNF